MKDDKWIDKLADKVDKIQDDVNSIKVDMSEHKTLFSEHLKTDEAMSVSVLEIEKHLSKIDVLLEAYNSQLEVHIAGVQELREANRIERRKREAYQEKVDILLGELKAPYTVAKGIAWVLGVVLSAGAVYKLFFG